MSVKNAEILRNQLLIIQNVAGISGEHAASGVENNRMIRNVEHQLAILFDENDGLSFLLQAPDGAPDLRDDQRRKTFRRFVEQKHPRIAHQRAPDCEHLLLAAGERAGKLRVALAQPRKHGVNPLDIPWLAGGALALLRHHQVFANRERRKDAASLRYETDPEVRDPFGAEPFDRLSK
jgi:hypothetical protein